MRVSRLKIENFRGIKQSELDFYGHTLLIGGNNVGKSTICEALDLALGPDRQARFPVVEEYDFYNAAYLDDKEETIDIRIEVLLTDVTPTVRRSCATYLERWRPAERKLLGKGELDSVDGEKVQWALRLITVARYSKEEDEFQATTHYATTYTRDDEDDSRVSRQVKRTFGFLYLRALRTGSRALSLERGSLLDLILRIQSLQTGIWEHVRDRLEKLDPPIDDDAKNLNPVLQSIEQRLADYIPMAKPGDATRLFVSQLTREHLRKTLSFFLSITPDQKPVPFQEVGTGTLNTLVLALLSFIAELKEENVIFAMEEPEIALPPHTQRRIVDYLLTKTTQCLVTSHSPYVIEGFEPEKVLILRRGDNAVVAGRQVSLEANVKAKTYRRHVRRGFAEAMLARGVIVAEGFTEVVTLQAVAAVMESDGKNYPLDLSGVSIITPDGDGGVAEFGRFFGSLGLPTFAFLDKKNRPQKERDALNTAGFKSLNITNFTSMEALLVAEVPTDCQWSYLEALRNNDVAAGPIIPATKPVDESAIKTLTNQVLAHGKGWGRAADLLEHCKPDELPASITTFMDQIYAQFPRPVVRPIAPDTSKTPSVEDGHPQSEEREGGQA